MDMKSKAGFFMPLASPHHELQESGLKVKLTLFVEVRDSKIELMLYFSDSE